MTQRQRGRPRHPDILTPAERRVLEELHKGGTNAEIAVRLDVSPDAIKFHISNMLAKVGLTDRHELAAWRPEAERRHLRALVAMPIGLSALARPLIWVGVGVAAVAGIAAVAVVLVVVQGNGERSAFVSPPSTATPQSSPAIQEQMPSPTPHPTPTASPTPAPTPIPSATATLTPTPSPDEPTPTTSQPPQPIHPQLPPSPTFDTPPGAYAAITVGADHACDLTEDGEVACWDIESGAVWDTPPEDYTFVTAKGSDTCAVTRSAAIVCWSWGAEPIPESGYDPSRDAPPGRYTAIGWDGPFSGDYGYSCAISVDGEAVCWGLEDADTALVPPEPAPGSYTMLSVEYRNSGLGLTVLTTCALTDPGDVVCWGSTAADGQHLGQSVERFPGSYTSVAATGPRYCALTARGEVEGCGLSSDEAARYVAVSADADHACAVTTAGGATCEPAWPFWLGDLSVMRPPDPSPERYVAISVGDTTYGTQSDPERVHACALTEAGAAVCWRSVVNKVERPDPPPGRYVAVNDGHGHTCALTEAGEAVCWGWNNYGQTQVKPGRYTAISAGEASTCALSEDGEAVCWGGAPSTPFTGGFTSGPYQAISVGACVACAVAKDGDAVCRGLHPLTGQRESPPGPFLSTVAGQCGDICGLTESGQAVCWNAAVDVEPLQPPSGRYLDIDLLCGITDQGEVICWAGEAPELPLGPYVAVSTGARHGCALTETGEARCWGSFGVRTNEGGFDYGPVDPPPGRYTALSSSLHRACALTEAGEVVCWGDTAYEEPPKVSLE